MGWFSFLSRKKRKEKFFWLFSSQSKEDRVLSSIEKYSFQEKKDRKHLQDAIDDAYSLEEQKKELLKLKDDIKQEYPKLLDEDVKRVLRITDDLLGKMPEEMVNSFVHSPDFEVYKKVLKKVHEPLKTAPQGDLEKLEKVVSLLEKGAITGDEARAMLGLPVRHLHAQKIEKKDKGQVLQELKKVRDEKN